MTKKPRKTATKAKKKYPKLHQVRDSINTAEAEAMFKFWCVTRNYAEVARHFGRPAPTVKRVSDEQNWRERYEKEILPAIQKSTNKSTTKEIVSNIEIVRKLKNAAVSSIAERLKNKSLNVTLRDVIDLIKLEVILAEEVPLENDNRGNAINIINQNITFTVEQAKAENEKITRRLRELAEQDIGRSGVPTLPPADNSGASMS